LEVLDYHKLKIFKTVADLESFSKAATVLFLSQPTITLQIKKIENYLGTTLFIREKNKVKLTPEGEILYKYAQKILEDYANMENDINILKNYKGNFLIIGASSTIGDYLLPKLIAKFSKENPEIKINLFIGNSKEVIDSIMSKIFNIGIIEEEADSNKLFNKKIYEDEIVLIASKNNPIKSKIDKSFLLTQKIILRECGSGTRKVIEKSLDILFKPVMEISSSKAIIDIVANSDYLAFVSKLIAMEFIDRVKIIDIDGIKISRPFSLITQKDIRLSSIENRFISFLKNNIVHYFYKTYNKL